MKELLRKKYHSIFASTFFLKDQKRESLLKPCFNAEEILATLTSQKSETLFLVGLDNGDLLVQLKEWVLEKSTRRVVFFDNNITRILAFLKMDRLIELLISHQIDVRLVLDDKFQEALNQTLLEFPAENFSLQISSDFKALNEQKLLMEVSRKAALSVSYFHEKAYYHLLVNNLLQNFLKIPKAFYADELLNAFKNIPVLICGAGPSLEKQIEEIKKIQGQVLIFAGGSALRALESFDITPDIAFALDPNPEEYERLSKNYEIKAPLLFGARLEPRALESWKGSIGYMKTASGGILESLLQERLNIYKQPLLSGLSEEALSVTTMIVSAAVSMGCHPIYLCGVDLAYTDGKRYSKGVGVVDNDTIELTSSCVNRVVDRLDRRGNTIKTTIKWVMEADVIETFAKSHLEVSIFDCVKEGLGFKELQKKTLDQIEHPILNKKMIEEAILRCRSFFQDRLEIESFILEIYKSLVKVKAIIKEMIAFSSKIGSYEKASEMAQMTLLELDLEEEKGYQIFLSPMKEHEEFLTQSKQEHWDLMSSIIDSILLSFESHALEKF